MNVNKALEFLLHERGIELICIPLTYPLSDAEILEKARGAIAENPGIRMAVFDAISSQPGVRFPFEAMTGLVQANGILAFIDGAHAAGNIQQKFLISTFSRINIRLLPKRSNIPGYTIA